MSGLDSNLTKLITTLGNDKELKLNLRVEFDREDEIYYIYHDRAENNFNKEETYKINTNLVKYLDSRGIWNYSFGFSESLVKSDEDKKELNNRLNSGISKGIFIKNFDLKTNPVNNSKQQRLGVAA